MLNADRYPTHADNKILFLYYVKSYLIQIRKYAYTSYKL